MSRFDLKHFTIHQEYTAQRVGTDAVLLGAWPWRQALPSGARLLDVGTGTGILALMLAQRFPEAQIEGWEVEQGALQDARYNVAQSPFASRLIIRDQAYEAGLDEAIPPFDLLISNPPYYTEDTLPRDARLGLARHTLHGLSPELLLRTAHRLLTLAGSLVMITPSESLPALRRIAVEAGWYLAEQVTVYALPDRPKRSLQLWRRLAQLTTYTPTLTSTLVLQDAPDRPSPAYRSWLRDFLPSID